MRSSPRFLWICIAIVAAAACAESQAAPQEAPVSPKRAPKPPTKPALAPPPAVAPTCTRGDDVDHFEPDGSTAIACFVNRRDKQRDCWRIEPTGAARPLPPAQWPAPGSGRAQGDRAPEVRMGDVLVHVPAPLKLKIDRPSEEAPPVIEVCNGSACKQLKLRPQKNILLQYLYSLTVLADGRTLLAGLGMGPTGAEAIERYDLDKPAAAPQRLKHPGQCGLILDVLAGNLLIQTSDCANAGGARVLMTPAGKLLANLGEFGTPQPYHALGGNRWLFEAYAGYAIWDLATGKRIAATKDSDNYGTAAAVVNGSILTVDDEGKLFGHDAALKPKELGAVPRCP